MMSTKNLRHLWQYLCLYGLISLCLIACGGGSTSKSNIDNMIASPSDPFPGIDGSGAPQVSQGPIQEINFDTTSTQSTIALKSSISANTSANNLATDSIDSIIVNGITYGTKNTEFLTSGEIQPNSKLDIGQYVVITSEIDTNTNIRTALSIEYQPNIIGEITAITDDYAVVLEQTIRFNSSTEYGDLTQSDLTMGDIIEASGPSLGESADSFSATRIDKLAKESIDTVEILGVISELNNSQKIFKLGNLTIDYSDADNLSSTNMPNIENGMRVVVNAMFVNAITDSLKAHTLRILTPYSQTLSNVGTFVLQGIVGRVNAPNEFILNNVRVQTNVNTLYQNGNQSDIGFYVELIVAGKYNSDNILEAQKIIIQPPLELGVIGVVTEVQADSERTGIIKLKVDNIDNEEVIIDIVIDKLTNFTSPNTQESFDISSINVDDVVDAFGVALTNSQAPNQPNIKANVLRTFPQGFDPDTLQIINFSGTVNDIIYDSIDPLMGTIILNSTNPVNGNTVLGVEVYVSSQTAYIDFVNFLGPALSLENIMIGDNISAIGNLSKNPNDPAKPNINAIQVNKIPNVN